MAQWARAGQTVAVACGLLLVGLSIPAAQAASHTSKVHFSPGAPDLGDPLAPGPRQRRVQGQSLRHRPALRAFEGHAHGRHRRRRRRDPEPLALRPGLRSPRESGDCQRLAGDVQDRAGSEVQLLRRPRRHAEGRDQDRHQDAGRGHLPRQAGASEVRRLLGLAGDADGNLLLGRAHLGSGVVVPRQRLPERQGHVRRHRHRAEGTHDRDQRDAPLTDPAQGRT